MSISLSVSLTHKMWPWKVAQSCLTLWDPMDYSHQAPLSMGFSRQEFWSGRAAIPFSRASSQPRYWTQVSGIVGRFFTKVGENEKKKSVKLETDWWWWKWGLMGGIKTQGRTSPVILIQPLLTITMKTQFPSALKVTSKWSNNTWKSPQLL